MTGTVVGSIDLAAILFTLFWVFFIGLVIYLRREDKREGYPLDSDRSGGVAVQGFPGLPRPKTFHLAHGGTVTAPRGAGDRRVVAAEPVAPHPGAPLVPTGDPMRDGVGPASYAERADTPDLAIDGRPRVVPMRTDASMSISRKDSDPRGMSVLATDNTPVATVVDAWVDRSEPQIFYLEIALDSEVGERVLLPMAFAEIDKRARRIRVKALYAHQFRHVPKLRAPDQVTLLEEDRITAYYAGGLFYADARRQEPLL